MDSYEINGVKHDFLFSLRAINEYQTRLLKATEEEGTTSTVDEVFEWAKLGFKYGNKGVLPFDESVLIDWMDEHFETALEISSICRQKMVRFNAALTGKEMAENVEQNGQSKKKKLTH